MSKNKFTVAIIGVGGRGGYAYGTLISQLPDQFEIVALGIVGSCDFTTNRRMEILDKNGNGTGKYTMNAKGTLYRAFNPEKDKTPAFKDEKTGELYSSIYARVLIRRKQNGN